TVHAFAENLRPGGKRTSFYSIQMLARRHPEWYRDDLTALFAVLAEGKLAPHVAAVLSGPQVPAARANLAGHGPPGKQVIAVSPTRLSLQSARRGRGSSALVLALAPGCPGSCPRSGRRRAVRWPPGARAGRRLARGRRQPRFARAARRAWCRGSGRCRLPGRVARRARPGRV